MSSGYSRLASLTLRPAQFGLAFVAMLSCPLPLCAQSSPTAPTAGQDPAILDRQWKDGNSKYDTQRKTILEDVDRVIKAGPYRADYESLDKYEIPEWYKDAKFGIFIHWGVYSVPAYGSEWYPREMYIQGSDIYKHHIATYGPQNKFGYKDFIPMFKAEHFDPQAWAHLFKESGARYVVPVFEHHDGFAMYDSRLSDWTVVKMGPHRDTSGELAKAIRAEGLRLGASSHRVEHNFFLGEGRKFDSDINDPKYAGFYGPAHAWIENKSPTPLSNDFTYLSSAYGDDWLARASEIVDKYHPDILYFDWWIGQPGLRQTLAKFAAFYYNKSLAYGDHVGVINYKDYALDEHSAVLDVERGQLADIRPLHWQTDTSISNKSWGYIENDTFKTPEFVVHQLVDIVSKNGNLLMNVGPRSDGTIPEEVQQVLLSVGGWLKVNGDAIYGTRPWKIYGEGPVKVVGGSFNDTKASDYTAADFRFTTKGATLYAIEMAWPANGEALIHSLGADGAGAHSKVQAVSLLGSAETLKFEQQSDGLHISVPSTHVGKFAYAFRIDLATAAK
jgi:alpha-L-fucosidase